MEDRPLAGPSRGRFFAASLAGLLLWACAGPGVDPEIEREPAPDRPIAAGTVLADARPVDVFVTLPQDRTRRGDLPLEALREALYLGLVERLYSPLSLDWGDGVLGYGAPVSPSMVQGDIEPAELGDLAEGSLEDSQAQEAAAPTPVAPRASAASPAEALNLLEADALLSVDLLEWDDSSLELDGRVLVRLRAALQDPRREGSGVLWGWEMSRWVQLDMRRSRSETRPMLWLDAVPQLAADVLELLPERAGI